jgi:transcriptional regulator with XRE-family HTH domain
MVRKIEGFGKMEGFDVDAYRRRLRIMREIIAGDNQTEFAKRLDIDFKRWSNYERGYPVPREVAFMLHHKFPGISIEWIWFGSYQSLSSYYKERILLAEKLDIEQQRNLEEMEKVKAKLNASAEKRRNALYPSKPTKSAKPTKQRVKA